MKRRFWFSFLLLAGILLVSAGLIGLTTVPDLMQYAFLPQETAQATTPMNTDMLPADDEYSGMDEADYTQASPGTTDTDQSNTPLLEQFDKALEAMGEAFPQLTLHSIRTGVYLDTGDGRPPSDVCVYAVGPSWHVVYNPPLVSGRPLVRMDAEKKAKVIVLDNETAFKFFEEKDPIGQTVKMGDGTELEVAGVVNHSRRLGELGEHAAWVPLDLITDSELMVLSVPLRHDTPESMFETQAQLYFGKGTIINLKKEKFRALMPLLLVFVIVAIWVLKRWIRRVTGYGKIQVEKVRAESKRRYVMRLLPYAAGQLLPAALLIVLTVAACFGVAVLALQPLQVFSEWIPETLGEYTSWISKFWQLVSASAQPVTMKTPELTEVQFWSSLILWGTMLILLRAAKNTLTGFLRKKEE